MGDSVVFQNSADPNVPPIEWTVVNEEYNLGIWALRFRWGEAEWADHFVLAEDIFGNIRLLEHNSVVVDMNEPPIVLPEVIADGQILIDCQGNEVKVVAVTAEIAPAPELGMPENFQACLFTERLSDGAPEVWAPGHGMVLTRKAGPGNQDYVPTSGLFAGEPLSGVLAAYHSTSWQIQHPWLPGLKVGDRLDWQGGGIHSGSQRSLEVVAQTYLPVSGIACLVLEDRIDWVNQTTLWIAEDALGNVRLLQEVRNGALRTYSPERAPVWLPALDEEGVHLGLRVGLMSAEVEHTEVEVVTTAGLGTFSSCTEIECEADGGFTKEEWFWTAGFGAVRIAHPGPGHWDLASIRLNGS